MSQVCAFLLGGHTPTGLDRSCPHPPLTCSLLLVLLLVPSSSCTRCTQPPLGVTPSTPPFPPVLTWISGDRPLCGHPPGKVITILAATVYLGLTRFLARSGATLTLPPCPEITDLPSTLHITLPPPCRPSPVAHLPSLPPWRRAVQLMGWHSNRRFSPLCRCWRNLLKLPPSPTPPCLSSDRGVARTLLSTAVAVLPIPPCPLKPPPNGAHCW